MKFKIAFLIIIIITILTILFTSHYREKELKYSLNFKIFKIKHIPGFKHDDLYNEKGELLDLQSYNINTFFNLQIGDIIKKEKNDSKIYIYRQDSIYLILNQN